MPVLCFPEVYQIYVDSCPEIFFTAGLFSWNNSDKNILKMKSFVKLLKANLFTLKEQLKHISFFTVQSSCQAGKILICMFFWGGFFFFLNFQSL